MLTRAALTLLILLHTAGLIAQPASLSGTWTLRLGERTLMVLTLAPSSQKGQVFSGSLAAPKHWTSGDGSTFTQVENGTLTKRVIASEWRGSSLFLTVQTPDKPADTDSFLLQLADADHAELHTAEMPAFTISLARSEKPAVVSTDWDPAKSYSVEDGLPSNSEMKRIFDEDQAVR